MMGAGKTTLGRQIARRLGLRFIDCDHEIATRTGVSIPMIFEIEGEAGFRQREANLLRELAGLSGVVVSTGGGIVIDPDNRALLRQSGLTVYLRATPELLYARTRHDASRPLLRVSDPRARIRELLALREPLYNDVADITIDSGRGTVSLLARQLEQEIRTRCAAST
jgi:shikimate kinase